MEIFISLDRNSKNLRWISYKSEKMSLNEIYMFLINPPNEKAWNPKLIAKHVFECLKIRNEKEDKM